MTKESKRQNVPERLMEWVETPIIGRSHLPYANPGELKADIRSLVEQYEGSITRESGLALIEDAKRWEKAYREARDELAGLKEQLEAAQREQARWLAWIERYRKDNAARATSSSVKEHVSSPATESK